MVYFEGNLLRDQVQGHHNMLEQIVHNYAGLFLFFASIVGIFIIYRNFRGSKMAWPAIIGGIFSTGLIGLGGAGEHLWTLHYLHMIGGPVALILLYEGLKEYTATKDIKPFSWSKVFIILSATILIPVALATQAHQRWAPEEIEGPFLVVTAVPTIVLALLLFNKARKSFEEHSTVVLNISFVAVATTLLTLALLVAMMGDTGLLNDATLYVNGHALEDLFHSAAATTIITFGISTEGLIRSM